MVRTVQWVAPAGVVWRVASTTSWMRSGLNSGLRPGRGRSRSRPGTPAAAKRARQSSTVGRLTSTACAMARLGIPSLANRMMRARWATFWGVVPARTRWASRFR